MEKALSSSDAPARTTSVVEWLVESGLGVCEVPEIVDERTETHILRTRRAVACDFTIYGDMFYIMHLRLNSRSTSSSSGPKE
jgi:hypothetical protein